MSASVDPRKLALPTLNADGSRKRVRPELFRGPKYRARSEEHTSELQSLRHLVCRLLLEKKNKRPRRAAAALAVLPPIKRDGRGANRRDADVAGRTSQRDDLQQGPREAADAARLGSHDAA